MGLKGHQVTDRWVQLVQQGLLNEHSVASEVLIPEIICVDGELSPLLRGEPTEEFWSDQVLSKYVQLAEYVDLGDELADYTQVENVAPSLGSDGSNWWLIRLTSAPVPRLQDVDRVLLGRHHWARSRRLRDSL